MKKSKTIILLLSLFFMFIGVVSAKDDPFAFDWRDNETITTEGSSSFNNLKYRNGYLTIYSEESYDYDVTYVRYYDINGNIIKEKKLNNMEIIDAITNNDNVYLLVSTYGYYDSYNRRIPEIVKLDDNFNVEESYDLDDDYSNFIGEANYLAPQFGMTTLSIVNDRLYILGEEFKIRSLDLDLGTIKYVKEDETSVKKYFPGIYYLAKLVFEYNMTYYTEYDYEEDEYNYSDSYYEALIREYGYNHYYGYETLPNIFISADTNNDYVAISGLYSECDEYNNEYYRWLTSFYPHIVTSLNSDELDEEDEDYGVSPTFAYSCPTPKNLIGLFDKSGKLIWSKENNNYYAFTNVKLINDYIVALGVGEYGSEIVIYDLDGKLVQTIESKNDGYGFLASTKDSFLVTNGTVGECSLPPKSINPVSQTLASSRYCEVLTNTEHYALPYNINVDLDGEAEVNANEQSFAGKKETIEVIPKEGYKVDSIIVTDSDGNVLEVEDNTFTMPASDVNVAIKIVEIEKEVEEPPVIENPNTNAFSITGIAVVAVGLGIVGIRYFKKLRFLK